MASEELHDRSACTLSWACRDSVLPYRPPQGTLFFSFKAPVASYSEETFLRKAYRQWPPPGSPSCTAGWLMIVQTYMLESFESQIWFHTSFSSNRLKGPGCHRWCHLLRNKALSHRWADWDSRGTDRSSFSSQPTHGNSQLAVPSVPGTYGQDTQIHKPRKAQ